ncbi:MAG: hypothetical protein JWN79_1623 [Gemmatimonadetes bacterium]|jgi:hypothetical protein|nr:hypothetical protein [Gemmatimonadota bacterium]
MSSRFTLLALALVVATSPSVGAQASAPPNPYKILTIARETVKPGRGPAHDKLESEWARAQMAAKSTYHFLAIRSLTGPRETWFLSGYPSWAEYTRLNKAYDDAPALAAIDARMAPQESEMLTDSRTMVLRLRDDLSYGQASLPDMRFFSISRVSVRPGHNAEFVDERKSVKAAHESAHVADSYSVYEATAGAPAGTFFVFIGRKSMSDIDDGEAIHGAAYLAALGGDEGRKRAAAAAANYLAGSQTDHYAFLPKQSMVSADWAKSDPSYWTVKMAGAPKP